MKINNDGLDIIKQNEGLRLTAYVCPAGVLTIGYGSTGPHVKRGLTITAEEAEDLLRKDVARFEDGVAALVTVDLNENQFSALVSFAFNVGLDALRKSSLLRLLNAGEYKAAANQFDKWVNGGGRRLPGLVKRRAQEKALFLKDAE